MNLFDELDRQAEAYKDELGRFQSKPMRAPMPYPGGKSRSVTRILPLLPHEKIYAEPFGGSFVIGLNRPPSPTDVYNDIDAGIVAFYRCLSSDRKLDALIRRLELTVHSKEEFYYTKETWDDDTISDVERAARWYYHLTYSFGGLGRNWGRTTKPAKATVPGKLRNVAPIFQKVHDRMKNVQIENAHWKEIFRDYDSPETVFYCDPPYVDAHRGTYKNEMSVEEHREFIDVCFSCEAFVAVSGYSNPLYDNQDWDSVWTWPSYVSASACAYTSGNNKKDLAGIDKRGHATECLWIKEAK